MTSVLTQVKQANVDAVLALSYPGDSVLYAQAGQGTRPRVARSSSSRSGPSDAFFPKAVGAVLGRRRRDDRALVAARRVEGIAGVLRRLREEVRRRPRLPELGAGLDVAARSSRPPSQRTAWTRRRSARSSAARPSRRSTARSSSTASRTRSRRPPSCSTRRASCSWSGRPPSPTLEVRGQEGLVTTGACRCSTSCCPGSCSSRPWSPVRSMRWSRSASTSSTARCACSTSRMATWSCWAPTATFWAFTLLGAVAAARRTVVAALGGLIGYALYRGVFRRLLAADPPNAGRLEGNSLLLFFGLSIIVQNVDRDGVHAQQPGVAVPRPMSARSATSR